MGSVSGIDVAASIQRGWLVKKKDFFDRFNYLFIFIFSLLPLVANTIILFHGWSAKLSVNEKSIAYPWFTISYPLAGYVLIRIFTEKKLVRINSSSGTKENFEFLISYAAEYHYELRRSSRNCVVIADNNSPIEGRNDLYTYYIFLLKENSLYYCTVRSGLRANLPSLIHHWVILRDVRKRIRKRDKEAGF